MIFVRPGKLLSPITQKSHRILCLVAKKIIPSGWGPPGRDTLFGTAFSSDRVKATPLRTSWDIKEVERAVVNHNIDTILFAYPFQESITSNRRADYDRTSVMVYFEYFDEYSELLACQLDDAPKLSTALELSKEDKAPWDSFADLLDKRNKNQESGSISLDAAVALQNFLCMNDTTTRNYPSNNVEEEEDKNDSKSEPSSDSEEDPPSSNPVEQNSPTSSSLKEEDPPASPDDPTTTDSKEE